MMLRQILRWVKKVWGDVHVAGPGWVGVVRDAHGSAAGDPGLPGSERMSAKAPPTWDDMLANNDRWKVALSQAAADVHAERCECGGYQDGDLRAAISPLRDEIRATEHVR